MVRGEEGDRGTHKYSVYNTITEVDWRLSVKGDVEKTEQNIQENVQAVDTPSQSLDVGTLQCA